MIGLVDLMICACGVCLWIAAILMAVAAVQEVSEKGDPMLRIMSGAFGFGGAIVFAIFGFAFFRIGLFY